MTVLPDRALNAVTVDANKEAFLAFMDHAERIQHCSIQTIRTYRYTLLDWLKYLGDRSLADVRPQDVEQWAARQRRGDKRPAAATARREVVVVRTFQQWVHERFGTASTVRSAHAPSAQSRAPKPIDDDVWLKFWDSEMSDSDRMWVGLGYFAGLRRIEIVTLRPENVDTHAGMMTFIRKGGSPEPIEHVEMGAAIEDLVVSEGFREWVRLFHEIVSERAALGANLVWWEATDDPINDPTRLNKRLSALLAARGMHGAFTPHQLRHSCATNLLRAGVPTELIRDALSHSSWDVTSHYAKTSGQLARSNARRQTEHSNGRQPKWSSG